MYLETKSTYICNRYRKLKSMFGFWSQHANHILSHLTGVTLQYDVIANFQFQRLGSHKQRLSHSLEVFMDRLCRLTVSLQIFGNIFEAVGN